MIKYRIRQVTIKYSKEKARQRRQKISDIENSRKVLEEKCGNNPTTENIEQLEILKLEHENIYEAFSKGAIIRSKATWYEKREKSNKYFLNLESHQKAKSSVRKIFSKEELLVTDPKKIWGVIEGFYSGLYKKDNLEPSENLMNTFLENPLMPRPSVDDSQACEGKLTIEECVKSLNSFEPNKSPGNDGLTVEFYKFFWNIVGELLVASLNYSYDVGELSNSQKKAIIILQDTVISNWRPISLIIVDVKIGLKAIAKRLECVLPSVIHFNQCAYVKGRTINFDAVRTVEDILEYTERFKINGRLIAIDFKKAFDSVSREFLFRTLSAAHFGSSFIQWIHTFYNNISSCVSNNGFATTHFDIQCGVRQGDPLSLYLFIIVLEILASTTSLDNDI